jgi:hypothetical protein
MAGWAMLRRSASSGEGMQQDRSRGVNIRRLAYLRVPPRRATLVVACLGLFAGLGTSAAHAQTYGSDNGTIWTKLIQNFGMTKSDAAIDYTERAPLVVPPSRDLPPPGSEGPPTPDWPKEPAKSVKHTKPKTAVVPDTAVQTPNPPVVKKPWYDPTGFFDREEYANFTGEPVRDRLTDPPAGYRIPSPNQPYGLGPEKKTAHTPTASDFNLGSASSSGSGK